MTKVGVMQPYFFPYLGYFQHVNKCDKWVLFDDTQYKNKGWVNRNRILHPNVDKKWSYITLPLKKASLKYIVDIDIDKSSNFCDRILGQLALYKKISSHYKHEIPFIESLISDEADNLSEYLYSLNYRLFEYFEIKCELICQSKSPLITTDRNSKCNSGTWALEISKELDASEYINPINGRHLFDKELYEKSGINLLFFEPELKPYSQRRTDFLSALSVLDLLLLHGRRAVINRIGLGSIML